MLNINKYIQDHTGIYIYINYVSLLEVVMLAEIAASRER